MMTLSGRTFRSIRSDGAIASWLNFFRIVDTLLRADSMLYAIRSLHSIALVMT